MGYFNFLYKLTRLFSNKKMLKTFFIILLIGIFYFVFIQPTFAASPYTEDYTDPYNAFTTNYGLIQRDFFMRVNRAYKLGSITATQFRNITNYIQNGQYLCYFMYSTSSSNYNNASPINDFGTITMYVIPLNNLSASLHNSDWFGISSISQYYLTIPTGLIRYRFSGTSFSSVTLSEEQHLYAPFQYLQYIDPFVDYYCSNVVNDGEINDILVNILDMTTNISENTEDINDFLTDTNANDSSFNRTPIQSPTDNVSTGIDSIFYMFESAFGASSGIVYPISLPIPHSTQTIDIPLDILSSRIQGTLVYTLIQLFWWYVIGSYIVKDIAHYLDKLQSGEIISHSDTNIKVDML